MINITCDNCIHKEVCIGVTYMTNLQMEINAKLDSVLFPESIKQHSWYGAMITCSEKIPCVHNSSREV